MQNTEYGLVRYEDAVAGAPWGYADDHRKARSHLAMSEDGTGFARIIVPADSSDTPAVLPREWLIELTRTPTYSTTQGESWLFHCTRPMVYVGEWGKAEFNAHAPNGDGEALFTDALLGWDAGELWRMMRENRLHSEISIYMFHCPVCQKYRGHWDMS